MSTLNLSPKNPLMVAALALGAVWFLSRRQAVASPNVRQPTVGAASITPSLVDSALRAVTSLFGGGTRSTQSQEEMAARDAAQAAVRAGDPYYGGAEGIAGTVPSESWYEQVQADAAAYGAASEGWIDYGTGDPYHGGY
ncbi:MAG: hypothetical protein NDJ19_00675 [Ramlibacter sp.]|nr:hypothetical protein [Ramlibacter sp.]